MESQAKVGVDGWKEGVVMLKEDKLAAVIGDIYVGAFDAVRAVMKDEPMTGMALVEIGTRLASLGADIPSADAPYLREVAEDVAAEIMGQLE
jgi:hypothetical protein